MKDYTGRDILPGDVLVYSSRSGLKEAQAFGVFEKRVSVYEHPVPETVPSWRRRRRYSLRRGDNIVVINK